MKFFFSVCRFERISGTQLDLSGKNIVWISHSILQEVSNRKNALSLQNKEDDSNIRMLSFVLKQKRTSKFHPSLFQKQFPINLVDFIRKNSLVSPLLFRSSPYLIFSFDTQGTSLYKQEEEKQKNFTFSPSCFSPSNHQEN